ncbi:MAG: nitrous oxide reductase accessory protein NosL [Bacteroidetes bacterium]|nr:nitrous oxide reductase accessory protein NosL [Bacteroidota bacterium]
MIIIFSILLFFFSCSSESEPINYGTDQCDHCRMTIMDKKFGAEIITKKGKAVKFDALECMINYQLENKINESDVDKYYCVDYSEPAKLKDAKEMTYLVSPKIKSPMGENISAYSGKNTAEKSLNDFGGEIFNWEGIKNRLKNNK